MRFSFEGEWTKLKLNDFTSRVIRKNKNYITNRPLTISAQFGLIDQNDFFDKQIASKDMSGYYLLFNGEFAYNKSYSNDYPFGAVKRLDKYSNGAISTLYICFRPNDKIVNSDFLSHYFETNKWHKEIKDISGEGARNHGLLNMSVDDYFNTTHFLPSLTEQDKISKLLNKIVSRIETQSKIIKDLEIFKNLIMDQLLTEKYFDELSLKDLTKFNYARIIKPSEMKEFQGDRLYLSTSSIDKNGIINFECKISYSKRPSRASMVPFKNSVWFAKMKDTLKVYKSENDDETKYILSTGFYGLLCNENKINSDWLLEIFRSNYFNNQKNKFSEGSSMSGIKDNQLEDIKIKVFKDRQLESYYCTLFNLVNNKIKIENILLERYKDQKKYLLANMFI